MARPNVRQLSDAEVYEQLARARPPEEVARLSLIC
jgi:hypothetical protein